MNHDGTPEQPATLPGAPEPCLSETRSIDSATEDSRSIVVPGSPSESEAFSEPLPEATPAATETANEPLLFQSWTEAGTDSGQALWPHPAVSRAVRVPHMGHLVILGLLALVALLVDGVLAQIALHFGLYGISTTEKALTDIHYTLGSMGILYLLTLAASMLVFPLIWHKSLFAGLQWNGAAAMRNRQRLLALTAACFLLAVISGSLLPSPDDTPIDKMFRTPGAAWLLFGFGVTFAPFFEEIVFRGFLLPALATAFDWMGERMSRRSAMEPDDRGHPNWSLAAMISASVFTSLIFALMHAEQTGKAVGPFLILVVVSLFLCWARLRTRSLAASVLVHACYNFMLFSLMLVGTQGFQHLNRM